MASSGEDRPDILITEQPIRCSLHMHHIFWMSTNTAKDAEDRLNKKRWFHQSFVKKMCEIIEMTDIIAFEFEARLVSTA